MQHGPIDLIIGAEGEPGSVARAFQCAHKAFLTVLDELVSELPLLRKPIPLVESAAAALADSMLCVESASAAAHVSDAASSITSRASAVIAPKTKLPSWKKPALEPRGEVAQRMYTAARQYSDVSEVTPMIAVAGSVADHILNAMLTVSKLQRVSINNGGDIALWLSSGECYSIGVCENTQTQKMGARLVIQSQDGVQGVATSGWRGRSHSLGIADAVTVLAGCAADADAAATVIGNAVDIPGSARIHRQPANTLFPDSDLGERLVTVEVDPLTQCEIGLALERGRQQASRLLSMQLISAAYLSLADNQVVCDQRVNHSLSVRRDKPVSSQCAGAMNA